MGWYGFDLDGTLAIHGSDVDSIGEPIAPMIAKVKALLDWGMEVRVITARVGSGREIEKLTQIRMIQNWCEKHIGVRLPVTCSKDFTMIMMYDDRCVAVECNTGKILGGIEPVCCLVGYDDK